MMQILTIVALAYIVVGIAVACTCMYRMYHEEGNLQLFDIVLATFIVIVWPPFLKLVRGCE